MKSSGCCATIFCSRPVLALRMRIRELAEARFRYDCHRICIPLRREECAVNHIRVYQKEGLSLDGKRPRLYASAAQHSFRKPPNFHSLAGI